MGSILTPWRRGMLLRTRITEKYNPTQWDQAEVEESRQIFSNFSAMDEGKSRERVCTVNPGHPDYEANRNLIEKAPMLKYTLEKLVELKNYKEKNGKDAFYEEAKENAWKEANELIDLLS